MDSNFWEYSTDKREHFLFWFHKFIFTGYCTINCWPLASKCQFFVTSTSNQRLVEWFNNVLSCVQGPIFVIDKFLENCPTLLHNIPVSLTAMTHCHFESGTNLLTSGWQNLGLRYGNQPENTACRGHAGRACWPAQ